MGAPASGTELNARAIFAAAGLNYEDLGKVEYLPFAESVELIKNRQLDATLQSAGLGVASIRDLATAVPINVVAVPADVVAKIGLPYMSVTIPAGTYDGQPEDVATAAVGNFLVTHDGVPEETAYQMTKLLVREPAGADCRARRGQGDRPGQGARRHAGPAASWRRALLQGEGPAEVAPRAGLPPSADDPAQRPRCRSKACRKAGATVWPAGRPMPSRSSFRSSRSTWPPCSLPSQVVRAMHVGFLLLLGFGLLANLRSSSAAGKAWFWLLGVAAGS